MTDTIEFLKTRRSVKPREMSGNGPSPAELETILTIGARVPDHGKLAPWRFIVFEGDARKRAGNVIATVFARKNPDAPHETVEAEKQRLSEAPLVIDCSSNIASRPIDWARVGLAYGGAQKNLGPAGLTLVIVREDLLGHALPITPSAFDYKIVADNDSM